MAYGIFVLFSKTLETLKITFDSLLSKFNILINLIVGIYIELFVVKYLLKLNYVILILIIYRDNDIKT